MFRFLQTSDVTTITRGIEGGYVVIVTGKDLTTAPEWPYEEVRSTWEQIVAEVNYAAEQEWKEYQAQRRESRRIEREQWRKQQDVRGRPLLVESVLIRWMAKALIGGQK